MSAQKPSCCPLLFSFTKAVGFGTLGARSAQEVSDVASIHTSLSMWSHPRGFPHSTCHVLTNDDQAKGDFGHLQETSASLQKGIPTTAQFFTFPSHRIFGDEIHETNLLSLIRL
jgi:hypothetical protein